ncbi:dynein axonemal assembly factor 5 [Frankliniella occidentalis]|uniref:Dynein axonemal assembly factor 5 n=1 Tax=Frankliniella occidentalis TaxID=133901 RepID=A0A6J1SRV7_FRAOC|nr:dynein axonemal assembly factor 5 [Frankliniella occidentalis]
MSSETHFVKQPNMSAQGDSVIDIALLQKNINCLQSEDKKKRKSALDELRSHIFPLCKSYPQLMQEHDDIFKSIIKCFSDQSEACRESSVNLLKDLLSENVHVKYNCALVMPVLTSRLGSDEVIETSEEVRYVLVELLHGLIKRFPKEISPFFNELIIILKKAILDPFPKIKKESCECARSLATAIPENFHMQSESLVKPLIQILTHQQYRVRVTAIHALGTVVRFGNNKSIKDASGPLAERLFDQAPQVRDAVTQTIGDWLINLPDRYSYFYVMIPLILTSLNDQSPEIQEKAWTLWSEAGEQWAKENEDDIKDKLDFLDAQPQHYPLNLRRPNIGCRTLVKRNLHKIASALVRELEDWLVDVRIKSSQLLCVIVVNAERDLHQYVEQLLLGMYRACNDEDARVVNNIERASHLMGYFIPPTNYWALIHPIMEDSCHQGHLRVLASLMSGSESTLLLSSIKTVADFLQQPSICRSREAVYQTQLVKCCQSILSVCGKDSVVVSQQIFNVLSTALALAASDDVQKFAQGTLSNLKTLEDLEKVSDLYKKFMRPLLLDVSSSPELWTVHCPERQIFQTLMLNSGPAISANLDLMIPTLTASLKPENQDAEMKLKLLTSVAIILQNADNTHCIDTPVMDPFLLSIIKGVIAPNLVWKAGRTAEALRTITVSCLLSILQTHGVRNEETTEYLVDSLTPIVLTLVEDSAKKSRLYSCHSLCHIICAAQKMSKLRSEHVHKIYPVVMKRLDDVDDDVRTTALGVLKNLFITLPDDYNIECSSAHIEALYSTLLVHLDDPSVQFGALVLEVLKEISFLKPIYLSDKLNTAKSSFRNQTACQELSSYIDSAHVLKMN